MTRRRALAALAAAGLFLACWTLLHHLWYRSSGEIVDTPVYERYGDAMVAGQVPYRDFALEYPPGALLPFLAPEVTAVRGDFGSYGHSFEKWMAGAGALMTVLAGLALAALRAPPGRAAAALGLIAVSPLLLGNVMLSRFDLWPAALTVGALAALLAGLDLTAAAVLGLAIATKLYPAVLLPLGLAWVWRRRGGRPGLAWLGLVAAVCAVAFLPFAALAPDGLQHSLGRQLGRPLQIESLGAAAMIALHHVAGLGIAIRTDHGSQNVESAGAGAVAAASTALQLAALVAIWVAFATGPARRERLVTAAAAAVVAFVGLGKVFSPQFMIWLVPLVPLVQSRAASLLLAVSLVLTQVWFPGRYFDLARELRPLVTWTLLARDVLVVALAVVLVRSLVRPLRTSGRYGGSWRPHLRPLRGR